MWYKQLTKYINSHHNIYLLPLPTAILMYELVCCAKCCLQWVINICVCLVEQMECLRLFHFNYNILSNFVIVIYVLMHNQTKFQFCICTKDGNKDIELNWIELSQLSLAVIQWIKIMKVVVYRDTWFLTSDT